MFMQNAMEVQKKYISPFHLVYQVQTGPKQKEKRKKGKESRPLMVIPDLSTLPNVSVHKKVFNQESLYYVLGSHKAAVSHTQKKR